MFPGELKRANQSFQGTRRRFGTRWDPGKVSCAAAENDDSVSLYRIFGKRPIVYLQRLDQTVCHGIETEAKEKGNSSAYECPAGIPMPAQYDKACENKKQQACWRQKEGQKDLE
jgi:hypothetical protein